jgi:RNA-directed DNA polymerase
MSDSVFHSLQQAPHQFYREYDQSKIKFGSKQIDKNGHDRKRRISSPIAVLKEEQRRILKKLENFDLPDCMYGGVRCKNSILNALQHLHNDFFFTVDLKDFFKNISNTQIHQTLINLGTTFEEARKITRVATLNQSLPQGAPTSTTLSNLAFAHTAKILEAYCKTNQITFTVFVDDLTFSSSKCFRRYTTEILELISGNKFRINHSKIHYRKGNCEITGLIVKKGKLQLPKVMSQHMDKPGIKAYADKVDQLFKAHIRNSII